MTAYDDLMAFQRETEALAQVAGRLGWDQETMMPRGAAEQRSEEMAAMEGVLHARRTDPRIADWLGQAVAADDVAAAQVRLIRRSYERATKVPGRLAQEIARVTSMAQGIWAEARAKEDVPGFLLVLAEVIRLRQEEGAALAQGGDPYDALIDDYEPGATATTYLGPDGRANTGDERWIEAIEIRPRAHSSPTATASGQTTSAAKSVSVTSTSCPTPLTSGSVCATTARTTRSSLNDHRSSSEPPPRHRISTSTSRRCAAIVSAATSAAGASLPCTALG